MTGHTAGSDGTRSGLGLYTDLYEIRMAASYLRHGMTQPATFSLFVRPTAERPWYVALGVHRVLELLDGFTFGPAELDELERLGVEPQLREAFAELHPTGEVRAVPDGTVVLGQEPILEVTAPLPIAQLLETAVMNLVHYPTLIATKAARCALVAGDRALADFGLRRAHGLESGVEAALAAYLGGGFATSNVEAGRRHGVPVTGTMAHSFVQAFTDEVEALTTFAADHPDNSTLLVDTYDTPTGVRRAIEAARRTGVRLRGVRLDSGDLSALAVEARRLLDDAGFDDAAIVASGGLDEFTMQELLSTGAPIDAFGLGTALTVSKDYPALDVVYKLVEYDGRPVAKFSGVKSTLPGRKQVWRGAGPDDDVLDVATAHRAVPGTGTGTGDGPGPGGPGAAPGGDTPGDGRRGLLSVVWRDGERLTEPFDREVVRKRVTDELATLPEGWRTPPYLDDPPVPVISDALHTLSESVRRAAFDGDDTDGAGGVAGPRERTDTTESTAPTDDGR